MPADSAQFPKRQARAIATRARIVEAALASLIEDGYAGTTSKSVGRRAGVARGTLLHHFPTRTAMVVGTVRYVLDERIEEFRQAVAILPSPPDGAAMVRLLWSILRGPTFYAWLELATASRTDQELRAEMRALMVDFDREVRELMRRLVPPGRLVPELYELLPIIVFGVLNNLAVDHIYRAPEDFPPIIGQLESLATMAEAVLQFGSAAPPDEPEQGSSR